MEKELLNLILFEIREIKGDMSEVKVRLTNLEDRMSNVEDLAKTNKETSASIINVVTSHYMEFKKYIKHNDIQHNLYDAKILEYKKEN